MGGVLDLRRGGGIGVGDTGAVVCGGGGGKHGAEGSRREEMVCGEVWGGEGRGEGGGSAGAAVEMGGGGLERSEGGTRMLSTGRRAQRHSMHFRDYSVARANMEYRNASKQWSSWVSMHSLFIFRNTQLHNVMHSMIH